MAAWNGRVWISQGSVFEGNTTVSQLTMVPLQNQHDAQGIIQGDRMLLMSGSLVNSSFGQASSMLFDGESFIPYIVSASASGNPGFVSGLFNSLANFSFTQRRKSILSDLEILVTLFIYRFPCRWCRHPNFHRHCRRHRLPTCLAWYPLDPLLPS